MAGKYTPFEEYLRALPIKQQEVTFSFEQIEGIIQTRLPSSAYGYREWWEHETEGNHINRRAWANAGWEIEGLNLEEKWVKFVRV